MVGTDPTLVEEQVRQARLACPDCGSELRPWGSARRRTVRGYGSVAPRRARCSGCRSTHVLLPVNCLARRADGVEVIGSALIEKAAGAGHRPIAARLDRPVSTVRGWLRAFGRNAERIRVLFMGLFAVLDAAPAPLAPAGSPFADAVSAMGAAVAAARRRVGAVVAGWSPWQVAAAASGGRLLAPDLAAGAGNTSWPWAAAG